MGTYLIKLDSWEDSWLNNKLSEFSATGRMPLKKGRHGVLVEILREAMRKDKSIPHFIDGKKVEDVSATDN